VNKLHNIAKNIKVEDEIEYYHLQLLNSLDQFSNSMQLKFNFTLNSSYLDADSYLQDLYLRPNKRVDYSLLTKLNQMVKTENLKLQRLLSNKHQNLLSASFLQDVISNSRMYNSGSPLRIQGGYFYQWWYELWYINNYRQLVLRGISGLFGLMSAFVVIVEICFFFNSEKSIVHNQRGMFAQMVSF
jgi:hypothetical protein